MFQDHSALTLWPSDTNRAVIFHGSRPRLVAFHVTSSKRMRAAANVRSMSSDKVRTRLSFGAGTARNCSIAYCFSVSTAAEKRRTRASLNAYRSATRAGSAPARINAWICEIGKDAEGFG